MMKWDMTGPEVPDEPSDKLDRAYLERLDEVRRMRDEWFANNGIVSEENPGPEPSEQ